MKLLVSFLTTEYEKMRSHWEKYSVPASNGKIGTYKAIGKDVELGGCLVELDWASKREIRRICLPCPSGFDYTSEGLVVASMRKNEIYLMDEEFEVKKCISNLYFNDVHSVSVSSNGVLITSTGIDGIIDLDLRGQTLWSWYAFEHGYTKDQFGRVRVLDLNMDHRICDYPTLCQTTHVNSAVENPNARYLIYASLFHQGQIIRINRKTNTHSVVWHGLKNCHSIRPTTDGFLVSNTRGSEVVVYDKEFKYVRSIPFNTTWLADAIQSRHGTYLIADAANFRIVEIDILGGVLSQYPYDKNWRIYQILEV